MGYIEAQKSYEKRLKNRAKGLKRIPKPKVHSDFTNRQTFTMPVSWADLPLEAIIKAKW